MVRISITRNIKKNSDNIFQKSFYILYELLNLEIYKYYFDFDWDFTNIVIARPTQNVLVASYYDENAFKITHYFLNPLSILNDPRPSKQRNKLKQNPLNYIFPQNTLRLLSAGTAKSQMLQKSSLIHPHVSIWLEFKLHGPLCDYVML